MTATLADDGVLVSRFNADPAAVATPIRPKGVGNIGERMILVPQEINQKITDEEIRDLAVSVSKKYNVIVIVPSGKRAAFWKKAASQILDKDNIDEGVAALKKGTHKGISVLLNKYDGVDLPEEACRLLIIDGLPEVYSLLERVETIALDGTELQLIRQVQKLEQGMGSGVRSSEDYCAVLLMGRKLTQRLHLPSARAKFTSATQAQLALGERVAEQLQGQSINELREILDLCLTRDAEWMAVSRNTLANASEGIASFVDPTVTNIRRAFDFARTGLWAQATDELQNAVNLTAEPALKGYLLQQLAEYMEHVNPVKAQELLLSAVPLNSRITRPLAGVSYSKLSTPTMDQAHTVVKYLAQFKTGTDLSIWANAVLDDLAWDEDETDRFEAAIQTVGYALGFGSQRPEVESGKGPDNLWAVGDSKYLIIECKSGSKSDVVGKTDCNQLIGSMQWFKSLYSAESSATPVMIHPSVTFDRHSSPYPETRIIDIAHLAGLKTAFRGYVMAIATGDSFKQPQFVGQMLKQFHLNGAAFLTVHSSHFKTSKK